ncbi:MAG: choice-of-anchor Q domain-containing protein [Anaerolineales bacterium]
MAYTDFYGNIPNDYTPPAGQNNRTTFNPAFVDAPNGDLRLSAGSPAIDSGVDLPEVTSDFFGHGRPFGSGWDRGAHEYTAASDCYARLNDGQVYTSVQAAVDAAAVPTDVVKVAGTCSGVSTRAGYTQSVFLSKTLTLRGGYASTDWQMAQYGPTVLDAQDQGRVLMLWTTGEGIAPVIENLHLTGGVAVQGGGIYVGDSVNATLRNDVIFGNSATSYGGGLYNEGVALIQHNTFYTNTASGSPTAGGGGLYNAGELTLRNSLVFNNSADDTGGGIAQATTASSSLDYNDFYGNTPDAYGSVDPGPHDISVEPALVDPAGTDFHLRETSPLVNAAPALPAVTSDFEADERPRGTRSDIGADESFTFSAVELSTNPPELALDLAAYQGQPVTFIHTFTNTGFTRSLTDTFDVTVQNPDGWEFTVLENVTGIELVSGESYAFTVVVTVPLTVTQGFYNETYVTVASQSSAIAEDRAVDIIANPGIEFFPDYEENADPGEVLTHTHTLRNLGPTDAFSVTLSSSRNWGKLIEPRDPVTLTTDQAIQVIVRVKVPAMAPAGVTDVSLVEATSRSFGISARVTDTTIANATAGDRYVSMGGNDTNNNCTQITDPCATVENAVQQAAGGDTIWIEEGTYAVEGNLGLYQDIALRGGGYRFDGEVLVHPDEIDPTTTILDFGGGSRGIRIEGVVGYEPLLEGVTIRNTTGSNGGAIYISGSSAPTLTHLIITNTSAQSGGGAIYVEGGNPLLDDIVIGASAASQGGALYNAGGTVLARRLRIHGSAATKEGGAIYNAGNLTLENTFVYSNTASAAGGGVYNVGVFNSINNTFYANQTATSGGALFDGGTLVLSNTIVVSNVAATGGGVYRSAAGPVTADYNNVWGNSAGTLPDGNLTPGPHSLSVNPLFVDPAQGDLHLTFDSPCMDQGDPNTYLEVDIDGDLRPTNQGYDIGADEIGGCLARVVDPATREPVSDVFGSVQQAVDVAPEAYVVQVAGICRGAQPRLVGGNLISQTLFVSKSLTLEGGYDSNFKVPDPVAGEDPVETILDARGLGRVLVLYPTGPVTEALSVEVLTMTLRSGDAGDELEGGGIYNAGGTLWLDQVTIVENQAVRGGGLYVKSGGSVRLGVVEVLSNTASYGAGLYNLGTTEVVSPTSFLYNAAGAAGGGLYNGGGGLMTLNRSTVMSNTAVNGAGLYNAASGDLTFYNTLVVSNTAATSGGGLYNLSPDLEARHDTFYANEAGSQGGGIYHNASSSGALVNSTILMANVAPSGGGGGIYSNNTLAFDYNDLYNNVGGDVVGGLVPGTGTMFEDPQFITFDPASPDFLHLMEGSPVEDQADPNSPVDEDIDGAPRPSNRGFDIGADELGNCFIRINGQAPTYGSPQRAVRDSQNGDVLFVAGTCRGVLPMTHGAQIISQTVFVTKSIGFQGGFTLDNWEEPQPDVFTTTFDAEGQGRVLYLSNSAVVTMAGLQLRKGAAGSGGGVFVENAVFTMTEGAIYSSTANLGGAFYNEAGTVYLGLQNDLYGNRATDGGAVYNAGGFLLLDGNDLYNNVAADEGGAFYMAGGSARVQNNFMRGNQAARGGAVYNGGGTLLNIWHNTLYANAAGHGGGLYTVNAVPEVRSNIFATNTASIEAHAIYAAVSYQGQVDYNDIVPAAGDTNANVVLGANGQHLAPGFVDAPAGDLRLEDDSPLLDLGDPSMTLDHDFEGDLRPGDQNFDIGADERRGCWARIVRTTGTEPEIFGPYANPQLAVDDSEPGDRIEITVGECIGVHDYEGLKQTLHITHNLSLAGGFSRDFESQYSYREGVDPETKTLFNARGDGRTWLITSTTAVTVERVSLLGGNAAGMGGALGGGDAGGGLYFPGGRVRLTGVDFYTNTATYGGGLYKPAGQLDLQVGELQGNTATDGGALLHAGGQMTVTGQVRFTANQASDDGGALYLAGGTVRVLEPGPEFPRQAFADNRADRGGAIFNDGGTLYLVGNQLQSNRARLGGAFYNSDLATVTFEGTEFRSNEATSDGGAFYNQQGAAVIDYGTRFAENTALQNGGAIYANNDNLLIHNSLFYWNEATNGGAVYVSSDAPDVVHNTLYQNNATGGGGGVYVAGGLPDVRNNIFDENSAATGSAVLVAAAGDANLSYNAYYPESAATQVVGDDPGTGNLNVDPDYVNVTEEDFHLSSYYSPLVDSGITLGKVDHDMDGDPRPINQASDIGADEYNACLAKIMGEDEIYGRIGTALSNAIAGDTILVAEGICEEYLTIDRDIQIDGGWEKDFSGKEDPPPPTSVDAYNTGKRVVTIQPDLIVQLSDISFYDGTALAGDLSGNGGGIYASSGVSLTLNNIEVGYCDAAGNGGGIYNAPGSRVNIWTSSFIDNKAVGHGGGIYNATTSDVVVSGGSNWSNDAGGDGGGIYAAAGAAFHLSHYALSYNSAGSNGGGLYNQVGSLRIVNVKYLENYAASGAGLYNTGENGTLLHNTIVDNQAADYGGGIYNMGDTLAINGSIVASNEITGTGSGAGIYSASGKNVQLSYSMRWDNDFQGPVDFDAGLNNQTLNPLLDWFGSPTTESPAIDFVDVDANIVTVDALNNRRPQLCAKDAGYHEYAVGNRAFEWGAMPEEVTWMPGTVHTHTFSLYNASERYLVMGDEETSFGKGTGYTETVTVDLHNTQAGWSQITQVTGAANVTIAGDGSSATFDLGPGSTAQIAVAVAIPQGQTASVDDDPSTMEIIHLTYEARQCPGGDLLTGESPTVVTKVGEDRTFAVGPDNYGFALPGETLTYTHVLTNQGNINGTFAIYASPGDYGTGYITYPPVNRVTLGPLMTQTIVISVTIRPEIAGDLVDHTGVVVQLLDESDNNPGPRAATNNTTIGYIAGTRYVATTGDDSLVNETASDPNAEDVPDNNCTQPFSAGPCATLQQALSQAQAGDEIHVAGGTYSTTYGVSLGGGTVVTQVAYIDTPVLIRGGYLADDWQNPDNAANRTILDAQGDGRAVYVSNVATATLEGLELTGGSMASGSGGNLYNAGADLTLHALRIYGGEAAEGAGLYSAGGTLSMINSLVHNNGNSEVTNAGGGLYAAAGTVSLLNDTFYANEAGTGGGAVYVNETLGMTNTIVAYTYVAAAGGGAVYAPASSVIDYNLYFSNVGDDVAGGVSKGGHHVSGIDPLFVDTVVDPPDLHIDKLSPARDAADPATTLDADYEGNPRPVPFGHRADIGAYEYVGDPGVIIGPEYNKTIDPGTSIRYVHTLTNTNDLTDTFAITVTSSLGWASAPSHATVEVGGLMTATVALTVTAPVGSGGLEDVTTIVASSLSGVAADSTTDWTTVRFTPGVDLSPAQTLVVPPAQPYTYTHTVTNTGTGQDTYNVTVAATPGWTVGSVGSLTLPMSATSPLTVVVTPPAAAISDTVGHVTVTVTSSYSPTVFDTATDILVVGRSRGIRIESDWTRTISTSGPISYTHVVTNTGNYTESVLLAAASSLGWTAAIVEPASPAEMGPFEALPVVLTLQVPPGSGGQTDVTVITATLQGTATFDTVTDTTQVEQTFGVSLTPEFQAQTVPAGSTVVYTHTLTNLGNAADNFQLQATNDLSGWGVQIAPEVASLASEASTTVVVTVTVPAGAYEEVNVTTVTATSITDSNYSAQAIDTTTVEPEPVPAIQVSKSVDPDPALLGEDLTYTIYVTNTGNVPLSGVVVTDTLPSQVTPNTPLSWPVGDLSVGAGWSMSFTVTASPTYTGPITNVVEVTTLEGPADVYTLTSEIAEARVAVRKSVTPDPVISGEPLTYTVYVTNTGGVDLTGVTVTDTLPANVTPSGEQVWTPGTLAVQGVWSDTLVVTAGAPGLITNTVEVATAEGAADAFTLVSRINPVPNPDLSVSKSVDPDLVFVGEPLTYTLEVVNTGNVTLTATITDTLPAGVTPNAPLTWTVSIPVEGSWSQVVVVTAVTEGPITNLVEVTTEEGAAGSDSVTSQVVRPDVSVSKSVHPAAVLAGGTLTYTLRVTNTGSVTLTAAITDTLPPEVTFGGATTWNEVLSPGAVWTQDLVVTVLPTITGFITNSVAVNTAEGVSGTASVAAGVVGTAGVLFTPDYTTTTGDGTVVTFTHTLTNAGDGPDVFYLASSSSLGWPVTLSENPVSLNPGASTVVEVYVTVPAGTGGLTNTTFITATSQADPTKWDAVTDTLAVNWTRALIFAPDRSATAAPGETLAYHHTITNAGNGTDTFVFDALSSSGWSVSVTPPAVTLAAGATHPVTVTLLVPPTAADGTSDTVSVQARAEGAPAVSYWVFDVTTVADPHFYIYLPLVMRNYNANLPDMVVTSITVDPATPTVGSPCTVNITVKNQGPVDVPEDNNFFVDFYDNIEPAYLMIGDRTWAVQASWFGAGESRVWSFSYTFDTAGEHTLYAQADTDDTVEERNEVNNITSQPLTITVLRAAGEGPAPTEERLPEYGPRPTPTPAP